MVIRSGVGGRDVRISNMRIDLQSNGAHLYSSPRLRRSMRAVSGCQGREGTTWESETDMGDRINQNSKLCGLGEYSITVSHVVYRM